MSGGVRGGGLSGGELVLVSAKLYLQNWKIRQDKVEKYGHDLSWVELGCEIISI